MAADTARAQIERILQILAFAAGDGVTYDDLARRLGVDRRQLDRDLATLTDRAFYLPGGAIDDIQVTLDADRARVWTTGQLRRPTRLTPGEAAALDLGLRILTAEREEPALLDRMRALLRRLARSIPDDDVLDRFIADGDPGAADALRALIIDAARRRRRVRFRYLKADAGAPEDRAVEPYAVACAEGRWYVVGRDPERDDIRIFRTDRILEASLGDAAFDPPADFDPADYIDAGRVYQADEEMEVVVRYGGRVAPWLIERGEGEPRDDGGVVVRHAVADPAWIVRHVLQYGPDACVVEPEWARAMVAAAAARLADAAEQAG